MSTNRANMLKIKIHECPYCKSKDIKEIIEKEIPPYNECQECHNIFPIAVKFTTGKERLENQRRRNLGRRQKEEQRRHKLDKIIETYLDLAEVIQNGGGCVSLIKDYRDKPLSGFLEDVCSTNNIRFKHNKRGS